MYNILYNYFILQELSGLFEGELKKWGLTPNESGEAPFL